MATVITHQSLPEKVVRLARYAEITTNIALVISVGFLLLMVPYFFLFDTGTLDSEIRGRFFAKNSSLQIDVLKRLFGLVLLFGSSVLGVVGIFYARSLFRGYQRGEVFTLLAAKTIRRIGWIVIGLSVVSQLTNLLGIVVFGFLASPPAFIISFSVEEEDIYAIVFGLLIVIMGHVMYEAVRLSDENREII